MYRQTHKSESHNKESEDHKDEEVFIMIVASCCVFYLLMQDSPAKLFESIAHFSDGPTCSSVYPKMRFDSSVISSQSYSKATSCREETKTSEDTDCSQSLLNM